MDKRTKNEILLTAICGVCMNGYSKAFRDAMSTKNQEERIEFMQMIIEDAKLDGSYEQAKGIANAITDFFVTEELEARFPQIRGYRA